MNFYNTARLDRQSNIECLRILAIFLILVVHADFWALGAPTPKEIHEMPIPSATRFLIESVSICAVNVFVMISGWFGIHPKAKSLFNFLFQCAFFLFGIYLVKIIVIRNISGEGIKGCLLLLKHNWFIKAYLMLYIFSPVLNEFVEHTNKKTFKIVLICYFLFQTVYGWCSEGAQWFKDGYSAISFMGIYLFMRYLRRFAPPYLPKKSSLFYMTLYISCALIITVLAILQTLHIIPGWLMFGKMYSYANPLVIIESLALFLLFTRFEFKSKVVNFIAASTFAVFLLHTNPNIGKPYFVPLINRVYQMYDGIACLSVLFAILVAIFILAIAIDQIRIWLGSCIWTRIINRNIRNNTVED